MAGPVELDAGVRGGGPPLGLDPKSFAFFLPGDNISPQLLGPIRCNGRGTGGKAPRAQAWRRPAVSPVYSGASGTETGTQYSPGSPIYGTGMHWNSYTGDPVETEEEGYESGHVPQHEFRRSAYPIDYDSETSAEPHTYHSDGQDEGGSEQETNYDSDGSSVREVSPSPQRHRWTRSRRVIDSDDEDGDASDAEPAAFSSNSEESDDTAIRPPQSQSLRRQRLQGQRRRRATHSQRGSNRGSANEEAQYSSRGGSASGGQSGGRRLYPVVNFSSRGRFPATRVY